MTSKGEVEVERYPAAEDVRRELLREVLDRFGSARLRVNGTSMVPSLWPGDVVMVTPVEASSIRPGNIVLLEREGRLFCHRVVELVVEAGSMRVCTQGDALHDPDPAAAEGAVLGVVSGVEHHLLPACRWILVRFKNWVCRSRPWTLRRSLH